jgi:Protein of unknown function (DUF2924)
MRALENARGAHERHGTARVAALKTTRTADLKQHWRELFGTEPPPYNRRFLESRLAYRIQELAYGGLKPETIARLEAIAEDLDGGDSDLRLCRRRVPPPEGIFRAGRPKQCHRSSGL